MAIHYSSLPERTRAMFDRKLAALDLSVRDFNRPTVDELLQRAAASAGHKDKLGPREADSAAAALRRAWDEAWSSYAARVAAPVADRR